MPMGRGAQHFRSGDSSDPISAGSEGLYFRFAAGLFLVVLVSMAGVWLEKQTLEMRRAVSVQYFQTDLLLELLVRLRLDTQKLTAQARLATVVDRNSENRRRSVPSGSVASGSVASGSDDSRGRSGRNTDYPLPASGDRTSQKARRDPSAPDLTETTSATEKSEGSRPGTPGRLPLLRFQRPFSPEGID